MKKLLFAVSALAALALLAPSTGFAHTYDNQVGLFLTPDGNGATGTDVIGAGVLVYLVLIQPTDVQDADAPYTTINAFECTLAFNPVPNNNLFLLSTALPDNALDVGQRKDINGGFLDFIVGIDVATPVQVVDGAALLATFNFMNMSAGTFDVTIGITPAPSIPGEMAFQSVQGELRVMWSAGGDPAAPIFEFNGSAVPVETESFGSVKALYR